MKLDNFRFWVTNLYKYGCMCVYKWSVTALLSRIKSENVIPICLYIMHHKHKALFKYSFLDSYSIIMRVSLCT